MDPGSQLNAALAGRYDIDREIGAGGMATVYLARDLKHNRKVALKVLKPELGAVLGVERFLAEIQVTANLQHPNLLPLFDSGEANGLLFYVMPFVEGESLRARLEREKQLPVDEAVRIAVAIAGALDYAHQHGVIHRDLKPENILLQAGQPVIADFGIALAVSKAGGARVTQTGLSLGTPQYMSPEQATGDKVIDGRTDIYSLAAMTYEMLTGEPPHTGTSAQAIIAKLMTEDVRPLTVLRRAVPAHVDAAVRHGLEKLAADRFATAGDLARALTGERPVVLAGAAAAGASGSGAIVPRPGWQTRALVGALSLVALGGVATSAWLGTWIRRSPGRRHWRPRPLPRADGFTWGDAVARGHSRRRAQSKYLRRRATARLHLV
jgi:serine/threonine-protein kinase